MRDIFSQTNKIFESAGSVLDKIDQLMALYEAAEDEQDKDKAKEDGGVEDIDLDAAMEEPDNAEAAGEDQPGMIDPTQPDPMAEGQPAEEDSGVYISTNQKAVIAKTMLDALMAQPPQAGEIPEELLKVTDANADQVIKFIQSLTSLSSTLDTSSTSDSNPESLASELKKVR